jgi:uncharacterized protein (DUF2384 family)
VNNHFRKRTNGPRLSPREAERQGLASRQAFAVLGRDDAITFLNTMDEALGGRPIDLAVQSDEGLAAVTQLLTQRGAGA